MTVFEKVISKIKEVHDVEIKSEDLGDYFLADNNNLQTCIEYTKTLLSCNDKDFDDFVWNNTLDTLIPFVNQINDEKLISLINEFDKKKNESKTLVKNITVFDTLRLHMEPINENDFALFENKIVDDYAFLGSIKQNYKNQMFFKIILKDTKEIIGYFGFVIVTKLFSVVSQNTANLEYYVFKEYRRKGYCIEAIQEGINLLVNDKLKYLFNDEKKYTYTIGSVLVSIIRICASEYNIESNEVAKKLGFRFEGNLSCCSSEEIYNECFYSLINQNYFK